MKLEKLKLLYAEDEKELRQSMKNLLEDEVGELHIVKNGEEAYESYKQNRFDVVVLDIVMPLLSGIEVAKKIRKKDHNTKIIILTAYSDLDNLLCATELKLTKYLIKPIVGNQLFDALEFAVEDINNFEVKAQKRLNLGDGFSWDFEQKAIYNKNIEIKLTPKEKEILDILFSNLNIVISYDNLLIDIWEDYERESLDTLKTMMKNIRKKIPKNIIKNIYGTGFKVIL